MLLKDVYNENFLQDFCQAILCFDKNFLVKDFLKITKNNWQDKSLKQRMRMISIAIEKNLSAKNYREKIFILRKTILEIPKNRNSSLAFIIFSDFVEVFGIEDFDFSMSALEFFTEFGSAEFAVRKFIKHDEDRALKFFKLWAKSKNFHVRRLASEGIRPLLPWGEVLLSFKKNPVKILEILEELKFDDEKYVKKSIANNLNDISKNHPEIILKLLTKWQKQGVDSGLIRHALRTLLKRGSPEALALIGINKSDTKFSIQKFALQKNIVKIGDSLAFNFTLDNQDLSKIRLEYLVYFLKKNKEYSKKIFQITTKNLSKGSFIFNKKHSFKDMSTRKHNKGFHMISLVINGTEFEKLQFELI